MKPGKFKYQIVAVLSPKIEDKEKETVLTKIEKMLAEFKVTVTKSHLGMKDLVYPIRKFDKGDFWDLSAESDTPLKLREINLFLNRENNIIRYLVLKK